MKKIGDTVRYRDDTNRNFTALVINVHSETCVSLVYCPKPGKAVQVDSVPHRSLVTPPSKHWLG